MVLPLTIDISATAGDQQVNRHMLMTQKYYVDADCDEIVLGCMGFLAGISVRCTGKSGHKWQDIPVSIWSWSWRSAEANYKLDEFTYPHGHAFTYGGVMLETAVPNVNSSLPYVLRLGRPHCPLEITQIEYGTKYAART